MMELHPKFKYSPDPGGQAVLPNLIPEFENLGFFSLAASLTKR